MLPRTLEPEVMDSPEEAADYDSMDHAAVNRLFAEDFLALAPAASPGGAASPPLRAGVGERIPVCRVLDVGTGTARIPIELCGRRGDLRITAVDLAGYMLQVAQRNVIQSGLSGQIRLEQADGKTLPYADAAFDAVISNSIIHHIPEPRLAFREMVRVVRSGGVLFVRDLLRPENRETVDQLVARYAAEANVHQRQMFRDSLHAALTLAEVRELLRDAGLPQDWVRQSSDRHWTISGMPG